MKKQISFLLTLLSVAVVFSQNDPQTFTRKIVIEQFTTARCGYCPGGAARIQSATSGNNNVIWLRYHAGFGTDDLTNPIATDMLRYYGTNETYAPAMMVDRTRFDQSNPGPVMSVGSVSQINRNLIDAKNVKTACKLQIPDVTYDPASRRLTGTVNGRFGDTIFGPDLRLQIFLVEDSLFMRQADNDQGGYVDFWHMGTVRDAITSQLGDPITVGDAPNYPFSHTIDYTLPDNFVPGHCKVVAIVYKYIPGNVNDNPILNASISNYISTSLAIGEVQSGTQARLFPNPATNTVVVESADPIQHITILDAAGRTCLSQPCSGQSHIALSVASYAPGLYIVRVQTPSGVATRRLVRR